MPTAMTNDVLVGAAAGALYGLTVWTGSYLGLLPALGVRITHGTIRRRERE
ncbi:MAG TPA: hypothetical protein VFU28_02545 [Vicinamibacterales bacterium]|nr:hypothetical protein [Vicinamibacterales bacterium]